MPAPTTTLSSNVAVVTHDAVLAQSGSSPIIEPDRGCRDELSAAAIRTANWTTDFSRHTVAFNEIRSGGVPRDGSSLFDDPNFDLAEESDGYLEDLQPVISFKGGSETQPYPLAILTWHETVNDAVGGVSVSVTFCPLCNSTMVFNRKLEGRVFDFGSSGYLWNSDLIMWDR